MIEVKPKEIDKQYVGKHFLIRLEGQEHKSVAKLTGFDKKEMSLKIVGTEGILVKEIPIHPIKFYDTSLEALEALSPNLRDLLALYQKGEVTAQAFESAVKKEVIDAVVPFEREDDQVYLSLNIQKKDEKQVTFRIGIQRLIGLEFTGVRYFKRTCLDEKGVARIKTTTHVTKCRFRADNGVTLVSVSGLPEWCPGGYYYSLLAMDKEYGREETQLKDGVFLEDAEEKCTALMSPELIRKYYQNMGGSSTYESSAHNQVIRGKVLKVMGQDNKNTEITVSHEDFEKIEYAVRRYNRYMNDNAAPGLINQKIFQSMGCERMITSKKDIEDA